MWNIDRRAFIHGSLCTIAAAAPTSRLVAATLQDAHKLPDPSKLDAASVHFAPDTLFLTWQRDPTTTMTIQWIGAATNADVAIRFSELAATEHLVAQTELRSYQNTELKVYRCELTGLKPGTEYKFQIGVSQAAYRFRTMPARITDEFRFISGGDSGVNEHALATNRLAAAQNPNFVLMAGDLAYDNGIAPETFTQFLRNYSATMFDSEHRMIPLVSCIGNHEVVGGYASAREKAPQYLSLFDGLFAERTYNTLDFGDYLSLVLLDTGHLAPVAGEQTDWLGKALEQKQDFPHLIVANHVPAYPSYRSPSGEEGKKGTGEDQRNHWCPLFQRYKVDVVLEHHDHTFKRTHALTDGLHDRNGIVYLGDGSWGKLRVPKKPEERPYLAKVESAYHMTVHSLQGDSRFHIAITDGARIADVYATHKKRPSRRG